MRAKKLSSLALANLNPLLNYAFRLTSNREEAEDLVQDTFERALAHPDTFSDAAAVRPVMFRILHNLFVNQWWAKKRRPTLVSFDEWRNGDSIPSLCSQDSFESSILRDSLSEEVESALSRLNETQRATVWLREIEGFSYDEIAEVTGVPAGTVRSRLVRGRRDLAQQLLSYAKERGFTHSDAADKGEGR